MNKTPQQKMVSFVHLKTSPSTSEEKRMVVTTVLRDMEAGLKYKDFFFDRTCPTKCPK